MPPAPTATRLVWRFAQLIAGLVLMGVAVTALKQSGLGLSPWDVLHDGIARHTGVDLGIVGIVLGVPILALWWPLRERPGVGTILNVVLVGTVIHALLPLTSPAHAIWVRATLGVTGLALFALGQGVYLSVDLGAGPRDGLMTGLNRHYRWSIQAARTVIESAALIGGIALGGSFGVATLVFAVAIGPMVQVTLRWFGYRDGKLVGVVGSEPIDAIGLSGE